MQHLPGVRADPSAPFEPQRADLPSVWVVQRKLGSRLHRHRAGTLSFPLAEINNPGRLLLPQAEALATHLVVALHRGVKNQSENWQPFADNGVEIRVDGPFKRCSMLLNVERLGPFSEVHDVIKLSGERHLFRLSGNRPNAGDAGRTRHVQTGHLLVTNLLVSDEVLEMVD